MTRPSTIDRLPAEVREEIGRLRQAGRTIDEILAKLRELGADVKRSSLGRHVQRLDDVAEKLRNSRAMAEALTARFGDQPDDRLQRVNIELLHGIVFETLTASAGSDEDGEGEGEPVTFDAKSVKLLSETLRNLAAAQKTEADRMLKAREAALADAARAVEKVARREGGMSAATIAAIKSEILGVGK